MDTTQQWGEMFCTPPPRGQVKNGDVFSAPPPPPTFANWGKSLDCLRWLFLIAGISQAIIVQQHYCCATTDFLWPMLKRMVNETWRSPLTLYYVIAAYRRYDYLQSSLVDLQNKVNGWTLSKSIGPIKFRRN